MVPGSASHCSVSLLSSSPVLTSWGGCDPALHAEWLAHALQWALEARSTQPRCQPDAAPGSPCRQSSGCLGLRTSPGALTFTGRPPGVRVCVHAPLSRHQVYWVAARLVALST